MVRDFTGSGRSELIVSSPWGMAILEAQGGSLVSPAISQNGAHLNAWLLNTQINHIGPIGRFDGDSKSSLLITSGWGLGILKVGANGLASTAMLAKGSSIGGPGIGGTLSGANSFTVDPTVCRFGPVGDFDGDHSDAVLVRNDTGIATLKQAGTVGLWAGVIAAFSSASRRSAIGGWELSDSDRFGPVADFDGDGRDEVLVFNAEGVGLINLASSNPGSLAVVANGTAMGSWTLDVTQDQFGPAADFDGDGKPELLVSNPNGFALLKYAGGGLTTLAVHKSGDWIGGWRLGGGDCIGPAADYNGNGRAEVLISSGWGVGLLSWTAAGWTASSITANGTALGGWRLDTTRNRMNLAYDFDGDGRAELLVSSGWGMGLLDIAKVTAKLAVANGTALGVGGWTPPAMTWK